MQLLNKGTVGSLMNPPCNRPFYKKFYFIEREKKHLSNILITWKKNLYAVIFENSPDYFQFIL